MCDSHGNCGTCGSQGRSVSGTSIKLLRYQIAKEGYGICFDFDGSPCFAYTVGLEETHQHPELLVSGLDYEMSRRTLADLIGLIRAGERLDSGESLHSAGGSVVMLAAVPYANVHRCLRAAAEYYGDRDFRALQVLWPDEQGHFPTDKACSDGVRMRQALFPQFM